MVWCVTSADDPVAGLTTRSAAVLDTLLPAAAGTVVGLSPLKQFPLGLNAERTLTDGAIVRIGNAAQTLHPVAGQGLNLGLRDAPRWSRRCAGADPASTAGAAARGMAARPRPLGMIATTDFLARSFTWRWPGMGALRGARMAALQAAAR
jgi:2-octaprenyl-6-methoxyphenol hydroxylase